MYRNNLKCKLKCDSEDSMDHIFTSCDPIINKLGNNNNISLDQIFGNITEQKQASTLFVQIDKLRLELIDEIENCDIVPPGGEDARTSGQDQLPPIVGGPDKQGCRVSDRAGVHYASL